jgi:hypothetical protein
LGLRGGVRRAWGCQSKGRLATCHQFLDAWFLNERIIVEAPGYPSAEDERYRRHGRLTAGPDITVGRSCLRAAT